MRYLIGNEEKVALKYISKAVEIATSSTCGRSKCGSVIVSGDEIVGVGFNSPPQNNEKQKRCLCSKDTYNKKVTDKTCCVHAEQRAIMDTLRNNPEKINNSTLYFIRLDNDEIPARAGKPYCTICSKMALDVGVKEFVLWHEEGICVYDTSEYNTLSFQFDE